MNSIKNTSTNVNMTAVNMMNVASAADMSMTAITVTTTAAHAAAEAALMMTRRKNPSSPLHCSAFRQCLLS